MELTQKFILIRIGINPPKWHDVIDIILENEEKLPAYVRGNIRKLRKDSKWLRSQREREIAFYGAEDFIPTKDYTMKEAKRAISVAQKFLDIAERIQK